MHILSSYFFVALCSFKFKQRIMPTGFSTEGGCWEIKRLFFSKNKLLIFKSISKQGRKRDRTQHARIGVKCYSRGGDSNLGVCLEKTKMSQLVWFGLTSNLYPTWCFFQSRQIFKKFNVHISSHWIKGVLLVSCNVIVIVLARLTFYHFTL